MGNYVANTRIKHNGEVFLPGEDISDVTFTEEQGRQLVQSGAVTTQEAWDDEHGDDEPAPAAAFGTPSNLSQIEGTALAADETGSGNSEDFEAEEVTSSDEALREAVKRNRTGRRMVELPLDLINPDAEVDEEKDKNTKPFASTDAADAVPEPEVEPTPSKPDTDVKPTPTKQAQGKPDTK